MDLPEHACGQARADLAVIDGNIDGDVAGNDRLAQSQAAKHPCQPG
jgi:hypothetical protein